MLSNHGEVSEDDTADSRDSVCFIHTQLSTFFIPPAAAAALVCEGSSDYHFSRQSSRAGIHGVWLSGLHPSLICHVGENVRCVGVSVFRMRLK